MSGHVVCETANFTLYALSGGVFAAIEKGGTAGSNAGIVDLGGTVVVFDTFVNIDAADELKQLCRELTGRDADYVVNSHSHADHTAGNCRFPEAVIISSPETMDDIIRTRVEFAGERASYPDEIVKLEAALKSATDKTEISDMNNSLFYLRNLSKAGVEFIAPQVAFTGELTLQGSRRALRLIACGAAHTMGDVIGFLPEDGVCFMGDMLFQHMHPWLGRGVPEKLLDALRRVLELPAERYIPGHGQLAGREDILLEMQYIQELLALVDERRGNVSDYSPQDLPPVFRDWDGLCFPWNIRFLLNRLKEQTGEPT